MNTIPTRRLLGGLLAYAGAGIAASDSTQHIVIDSGDTEWNATPWAAQQG